LVRAPSLRIRLAGFVALAAVLGVLAGCGASGATGSADPTTACANAHARLTPIAAAALRPSAVVAAQSAQAAIHQLNLTLGALSGTPQDPEALINLRNGTGYLANEFRNVAALLVQSGSGLVGPLRSQGAAVFTQIDRAAAQLGAPACSATSLGRPLFGALLARATAPAGPNLTVAARTACQNIQAAYGTTQVAVDGAAARAQLERSSAALAAARTDVADVPGNRVARLRGSLTRAIAVLDAATSRVAAGASPATTTITAFARASAMLAAGFRSTGVVCAVPGS
jgi:hypothetical protein